MLYPVEVHARRVAAQQPIPLYTEPMTDEALASWLCRLATKIDMSPLEFIRHAFGIDCRADAQWWRRPSGEQLTAIAQGTGVGIERLAGMTLADWSLARMDEHPGRLSAQYALHPPPRHAADRFIAVCLHCLAEDKLPYVRRDWMIGWQAACSRHQCRLVHRCPVCFAELRIGHLGGLETVVMDRCPRCGAQWCQLDIPAASTAVLRLQDRLLDMKHRGVADLPGLGRVEWATFMVIADMVATAIWLETADYHRERAFKRTLHDLGMSAGERLVIEWPSNYGTLLMLSWILEDWPDRLKQMLEDMHAPDIEHILDWLPEVDDRLLKRLPDLLGPAWDHCRQVPAIDNWREWLDRIVAEGMDFRTLARRERHQGYLERLMVFAMLAEGRSINQAAASVGLTPATVKGWIESAIAYGIHMVIDKPMRRSHLTPEQLSEIGQWLASAAWLASSRVGWRPDHVRREIALQFGVNVSASVAQSLLLKTRTPMSGLTCSWSPVPSESRN